MPERKELNENAKKWVAALRSEKYTQARRQLRTGDGYCCLGVACDLYSNEVGEQWVLEDNNYSFLHEDLALPKKVMDWLGLSNWEGRYSSEPVSELTHLSNRNDNGATFAEIADIIESQPEGLFV